MPTPIEVESTLTDRYQTTVPESVRRALGLSRRDKIQYTIRSDGDVVMTRAAPANGDDPALGKFLDFLAQDIASHPEHVRTVDAGLVKHLRSLVSGVDVDLAAALSADDE